MQNEKLKAMKMKNRQTNKKTHTGGSAIIIQRTKYSNN